MKKLGSHISFTAPDYLLKAGQESLDNGANTMMIYLGAPQSARRIDKEKYKVEEFKELNPFPIKDIVVHAPYIVNPASIDKADFAVQFLVEEIQRMNYVGIKYLVLHPGAHTKYGREESIDKLVESLKRIFEKTKDVEILLETMSGKGTELGTTLEELKLIIDMVGSPRLGICIDTCHVWEAGYDIKNNLEGFVSKLKDLNILERVKVLHINDSKNQKGAHKDRHENIGKGFIGFEAIKSFVDHEAFRDIIQILETPWVDGKPIYKEEIKVLK